MNCPTAPKLRTIYAEVFRLIEQDPVLMGTRYGALVRALPKRWTLWVEQTSGVQRIRIGGGSSRYEQWFCRHFRSEIMTLTRDTFMWVNAHLRRDDLWAGALVGRKQIVQYAPKRMAEWIYRGVIYRAEAISTAQD